MIRRMTISPTFVLHLRQGEVAVVVAEAIPADAKILQSGYDAGLDDFFVDIESASFTSEAPLNPVLRSVDPRNLEDREILRAKLAEGAGG